LTVFVFASSPHLSELFVRKLVSARIVRFQLEQQKSSVLLPFLRPRSNAVEDGGDLILGHDLHHNMSATAGQSMLWPPTEFTIVGRQQESKETQNEGILAQGTPGIDSGRAD
jgi:hypothetical protein